MEQGLYEYDNALAKVGVVSSNLIARSKNPVQKTLFHNALSASACYVRL